MDKRIYTAGHPTRHSLLATRCVTMLLYIPTVVYAVHQSRNIWMDSYTYRCHPLATGHSPLANMWHGWI